MEAEESRRRVDVQHSIFESLRQRSTGLLALIAGASYLQISTDAAWSGTTWSLALNALLAVLASIVNLPTWDISYGLPRGKLAEVHSQFAGEHKPQQATPEVLDAILWKAAGQCWDSAFDENDHQLRWMRGIMVVALYGWVINTAGWLVLTAVFPGS